LGSDRERDPRNNLEPYSYQRHLFAVLPKANTVDGIEVLLPGNVGKDSDHTALGAPAFVKRLLSTFDSLTMTCPLAKYERLHQKR